MLRPRSAFLRSNLLLRPQPSRYPRRHNQTAASPTATSTPASPKRSRFRISYIWYGLVLITGGGLGFTVRNFAAPIPFPLPGSREDELALKALTSDVEKLDIVKYMRSQGYHLHADTPLSSLGKNAAHKSWVELDMKTNITESKEDWGQKTRTVTWESMAGARGLGVQRAFWNAETRELVAVVWIGGALSGWPGLAHGGAVATIFQDCMSRMIAGPNVSIGKLIHAFSYIKDEC